MEKLRAYDTMLYEPCDFLKSLPETGYIRLPDVLRLIPVGKSTWWTGIKTGRYPKPVKLGARATAWRVEDIRALIKSLAE